MSAGLSSVNQTEPPVPLTQSASSAVGADEQLLDAFGQFAELSDQLRQAYGSLEHRVQDLTQQLRVVDNERLTALEERETLAQRLEHLLTVLPAGVIVINACGVIAQTNPAAEQLLQFRGDLQGASWREVMSACFAPGTDSAHEVSTREGRRLGIVTQSFSDPELEAGQILLITDQTETRRLQDQVSCYERMASMGRMASALAHQIRTPLSAAILYAGHLSASQLSAAQHRRCVEKLQGRLQHMERQVRDMLLFVKGELPLNERLPVTDLVRQWQAAMEVVLTEGQVRCHWQVDCPRVVIRCHADVLVSALMNLINNALQAIVVDPELRIVICKKGDYLHINISDNGPGIPASQLAKVEQPFFTTKPQGIGLGLAVVKRVVTSHGGQLNLQSSSAGTTACLMIPVCK